MKRRSTITGKAPVTIRRYGTINAAVPTTAQVDDLIRDYLTLRDYYESVEPDAPGYRTAQQRLLKMWRHVGALQRTIYGERTA